MNYDQMVHAIFAKPSSLDVDVSDIKIRSILSVSPDELDWGDLGIAMDGTFEQSGYFIPSAFHYIEQMREEWPQVGFSLVSTIAGRRSCLTKIGIYDKTLDRLSKAFQSLTSVYEKDRRSGAATNFVISAIGCVANGQCRADFIGTLFKFELMYRESTLFDALLQDWANSFECWQRSATFLDFLVHVDLAPYRRIVYIAPLVVALRSDTELCRKHFKIAKDKICMICPPEYIDYIANEICGRE